jgi:hypothetical protein
MSIQSMLAKPLAKWIRRQTDAWASKPEDTQGRVLKKLLPQLAKTHFGKAHGITGNEDYKSFSEKIPIHDYEGLKSWFERIANGEADVCWPGKPIYLAKTSGTTSGAKYIPITKASIPNHIRSARNALLNYIAETGNSRFLDGKLIFLSGSPVLESKSGIPLGRLSGIVNHHVPAYLRKNQMPKWETNCIEDWEKKVVQIARETRHEKMTLISGIPPWVQMYFDQLISMSDEEKVSDIFPDFSVFVYGGVNFEPYRDKLERSMGKRVDSIELYPASEGFFAYQDKQDDHGMLLLLNDGIYYEFIPLDELHHPNPKRININEVQKDVNYALILHTNAGLWGYMIGDTIKFTSLYPHKIVVSGRIKHYISAFGEHVIGEEVEYALMRASQQLGIPVAEFTVAPQVNPESGLPYHEWFIAFDQMPIRLDELAQLTDANLQKKNIYYKDLIEGKVLRPLKITALQSDAFIQYMKSQGKLGGQNKVPRLSNDRKIADELHNYKLQ